ncbi:MAG: PAS domain S-box protein [Labilithrix sp.]
MSSHDSERVRARLSSIADPTAFLVGLFASAPLGIAVWDASGNVVLTNRAFFDIFQSEPPPGYNVLTDEQLAKNGTRPLFERAFRGETVQVPVFWYDPRDHAELQIKEGRRVAISMTLFPVKGVTGELEYVAATYKDDTENMLAAERLRRNDERFRLAEQAGRFGTFEWDAASGMSIWSPQLAALYGLKGDESELTKQNWPSLVHPDDRANAVATIERAFETNKPVEGEWRIVARDGTTRWVVGRFLSPPGPRRLIGVNVDITERKHAELVAQAASDALERSEVRFRRLAEAGIIGVTITDSTGRFHYANDAFLAVVGYSREDFAKGLVTSQVVNLENRSAVDLLASRELRERGLAGPWEKELVRKDGARVPVVVGAVRSGDDSDEIIAFVLDLTERQRSEAQRAAVVETAIDAIVMMDQDGKVLEFNPAAERTFGHARANVIGKLLADVVIPERLRERHRVGLRRFLETGVGPSVGKRVETVALRSDGTEFPAEVAIVCIRSPDASTFTGYIRDITDRRRAAESELLRREKEAAQAANRELEAFSYSVAHDLRAPLRGISGFAGVVLEDYGAVLDEAGRGYLDRIVAGATRMGHIIDSLLALARVTRTELQLEATDLAAIGRSVIEQLQSRDQGRAVTFVTGDSLLVRGDPSLLRTVLENLLGNAWKFTRDERNARIELGHRVVDGEPQYFVSDNGAGFDMRYIHQLFKAFQRLHSSEKFEGTGVGLATVQRVVNRHGGRVWAEAKENHGATFFFTLPTGAA